MYDMLPLEHRLKAEKFLQNVVKKCQKTTSNIHSASANASLSLMTTPCTIPSKSTTILKNFLTKCDVNSNVDAVELNRSLTIQQELARMISLSKENQEC